MSQPSLAWSDDGELADIYDGRSVDSNDAFEADAFAADDFSAAQMLWGASGVLRYDYEECLDYQRHDTRRHDCPTLVPRERFMEAGVDPDGSNAGHWANIEQANDTRNGDETDRMYRGYCGRCVLPDCNDADCPVQRRHRKWALEHKHYRWGTTWHRSMFPTDLPSEASLDTSQDSIPSEPYSLNTDVGVHRESWQPFQNIQ